MRKITVIAIALIYFAVSSGIIVNLHYCMDRFASADFSLSALKNKCESCGMHKTASQGCCHDEVKLVKLQDDQQNTIQASTVFSTPLLPATIPSVFIVTSFCNGDETRHRLDHLPPLLSGQDIHLQNCVFRI